MSYMSAVLWVFHMHLPLSRAEQIPPFTKSWEDDEYVQGLSYTIKASYR